jgi:hypothetical protein
MTSEVSNPCKQCAVRQRDGLPPFMVCPHPRGDMPRLKELHARLAARWRSLNAGYEGDQGIEDSLAYAKNNYPTLGDARLACSVFNIDYEA